MRASDIGCSCSVGAGCEKYEHMNQTLGDSQNITTVCCVSLGSTTNKKRVAHSSSAGFGLEWSVCRRPSWTRGKLSTEHQPTGSQNYKQEAWTRTSHFSNFILWDDSLSCLLLFSLGFTRFLQLFLPLWSSCGIQNSHSLKCTAFLSFQARFKKKIPLPTSRDNFHDVIQVLLYF